jgi:hypothetical protein
VTGNNNYYYHYFRKGSDNWELQFNFFLLHTCSVFRHIPEFISTSFQLIHVTQELDRPILFMHTPVPSAVITPCYVMTGYSQISFIRFQEVSGSSSEAREFPAFISCTPVIAPELLLVTSWRKVAWKWRNLHNEEIYH